MLSCIVGNNYVNTVDYEKKELKKWSKKGILKCPVCNRKLIYKHGEIREPYFSHEKDSECIYTFYENETKEHALGKVLLYKWLKSLKNVSNVKLEGYIPETKQRPDLYFEIDDKRFVIEYQCTPILKSEYNTRHELYKLNGIIDIWILGTENYNGQDFDYLTEKSDVIIKHKIKESELFVNNFAYIYYINPFNETLTIANKKEMRLVSNKVITYWTYCSPIELCWIDNDIITNNNINYYQFIYLKDTYIKYIERINTKYKYELLNYQKNIYDYTKNDYIRNKKVYLYTCTIYEHLLKYARNNKFRFLLHRDSKLTYKDLESEILTYTNTDVLHIFCTKINFKKRGLSKKILNNLNVVLVKDGDMIGRC